MVGFLWFGNFLPGRPENDDLNMRWIDWERFGVVDDRDVKASLALPI